MSAEHVAARFREARERAGLNQTQVAEYLGVQASSISHYESGRSQPSFDAIFSLAALYEVAAAWFFETTSLGDRLRHHRASSGLTLKELADKCGLSVSYLSDLERGRVEPSLKTLRKLAGVYGVELTELLNGITWDEDEATD